MSAEAFLLLCTRFDIAAPAGIESCTRFLRGRAPLKLMYYVHYELRVTLHAACEKE